MSGLAVAFQDEEDPAAEPLGRTVPFPPPSGAGSFSPGLEALVVNAKLTLSVVALVAVAGTSYLVLREDDRVTPRSVAACLPRSL